MAPLGLYIHIPYCRSICPYCNFFRKESASVPDDYMDYLIKEASSYREDKPISLDTIYIGGGTPSLLTGEQIKRLMDNISKIYDLSNMSEFTIEVNPESINKNLCGEFIKNGINRMSIGIQSLNDLELKALGRLADRETCLKAIKIIRDLGVENISVDLMGGIPSQDTNSFLKSIAQVVDLGIKHISFYLLEMHPGTPLSTKIENGAIEVMREDEEASLYLKALDFFEKSGYRQYEISNFSIPGFECKHNLLYWKIEEYIGIGPSAHSHFRSWRHANVSDINEYVEMLNQDELPISERERMSEKRYIEDTIIFGLRLREGLNANKLKEMVGFDLFEKREEKIRNLESTGYIESADGSVRLTREGMALSNEIINFLFSDLFN